MKSLSNSTNVIISPSFCWFLPALDTDNAPVKKQVFELLSALCMYSADGYARAIDALGHYKVRTTKRFHLSFHSSAERQTKVKQISWHVYPVVKCGILSLPKWLGIHSFIATYSDQQLKWITYLSSLQLCEFEWDLSEKLWLSCASFYKCLWESVRPNHCGLRFERFERFVRFVRFWVRAFAEKIPSNVTY